MRASAAVRVLEAVAALLSAGVLVIGVALAVLTVAAPALVHGSGLSAASGPQPGRVVVPLVGGLLGELAHVWRSRLPDRIRWAAALLVIVAELVVLWWGWWR